ncbi:MAG: hypothetical protein U9N87_02990 [Planctomycetota bacterium]|nr:hypothetical protein [Planctomycetota bacterium]
MARRPAVDDDGSMDSLLDTMMNVVGILVLVLVVTQLGVGDAVKRITETANIDPQVLKEKEKELASSKAERDTLLAVMEESLPTKTDAERQKARLEELRREIAEKEKLLTQLEQKHKEEQAKIKRNLTAKKEIEKNKKEREQLQSELSATLKEIARLEAALADTPPRQALPPKVISLPNPRPAPKDAKQLTFLCSENKVYPLPAGPALEQIRKLSQARTLQVAMKQRRTFNPTTGEGTDRFLKIFNKKPWRNDYFEAKLTNRSSHPRLVFYPLTNGGETEKVVRATRSKFQKSLDMIDKSKYFIRFYVCTDSFDIYVTTRRIVSDKGLLAGWEPQSKGWKYVTSLGGKLAFGPPPKPSPPPKTPPKPRPKPTGNVID